MNRTEDEFRKQLILVSSLFHGTQPGEEVSANCGRVLRRALLAAGLWNNGLRGALHDTETEPSIVTVWYSTLIELTQQEPESERLLAGAGNLAGRAGPHFTACWLTPRGRVVAQRLAEEHPEWVASIADEAQ
jgi:hypothetical protein